MECRVLEYNNCEVTQGYTKGKHNGVDLVGGGYTLDYITAHSDGVVVEARNDFVGFKSGSYGNYVKIKHKNYYTLYAHMKIGSVRVKKGDYVKGGEIIGYMGNTGESFGAHLHFEVRDRNDVRINPEEFINNDLPEKDSLSNYSDYELAQLVMRGDFGNGDVRKERLGKRYKKVQNLVNSMYVDPLSKYTNEELAHMVWMGEFGNGEERKRKLGSRYEVVQKLVNIGVGK